MKDKETLNAEWVKSTEELPEDGDASKLQWRIPVLLAPDIT